MRVGLFGVIRDKFIINLNELFAAGTSNICSKSWVPAAAEAEYAAEFNINLPEFVFLVLWCLEEEMLEM